MASAPSRAARCRSAVPLADITLRWYCWRFVGTATYSGPAAGMFVMKTDIDDDNMGPVPTEAGKFTADTELTAKFGSSPTDRG